MTPLLLELEFTRAERAGDPFGFRFVPQEYVLRSAQGGARSASFPWDEKLLAALAALHSLQRDPTVAQQIGETLRRFIEPLGWSAQQDQIELAVREGRGVIVTLRSAAAELYALPWELLTIRATGQHLGELPGVLLRYEWPETQTAQPIAEGVTPGAPQRPESLSSAASEGGRILFAWSAAGGAVPASKHLTAISRACSAGYLPFDPDADVLPHASCARLSAALDAAQRGQRRIAVLHLLCHGGAAGSTFGVILDGDSAESGPCAVDAGALRRLLAPYAAMLRLVVLCACDSGNTGPPGNELGSLAQTLHRIGIAAVVASRYPLSVAGSITLTQGLYEELLHGPGSLENALLAAREQLMRDAGTSDWASLQLYARGADGFDTRPVVFRPYRGLLSYLPEHSRFLCGRDAEISELLSDLRKLQQSGRPRFLIVAGASGTGKSSMTLAGAVPKLLERKEERWEFALMRPGQGPVAALDELLVRRKDTTAGSRLLLVVDQFEEVFTICESPAQRQAFSQKLWSLAGADSAITVLVTLRIDFIGRCGELLLDGSGLRMDRVAYDESFRIFVPQLGRTQLERAITEPAQRVGLSLEPGLTQRLLDDAGAEPGALPLLGDTLDLLWQRRRGRVLTQAAYEAISGLAGALRMRADALIDSLNQEEQETARQLLLRLVSSRTETALDTRRRALLDELRPAAAQVAARFDRVSARLVDERLLVRGEEAGRTTLEVAHEALLRHWERLRQWVEEDRERLLQLRKLGEWAAEWQARGTLLSEKQLAFAELAASRSTQDFSSAITQMLQESRRHAEERKQRQRRTSIAVGCAALGFAALAAGAINRSFVAERASKEAQLRASQARDASRMSAVRALGAGDPSSVIALLREVESADPDRLIGWMEAIPYFTPAPVPVIEREIRHEHPGESTRSVSPDGRRVLITHGGNGYLFVPSDRAEPLVLTGMDSVIASAFSANGNLVASGGMDGTLRIWDEAGKLVASHALKQPIQSLSFSPSGDRVLVTTQEGAARIVRIDGAGSVDLQGPPSMSVAASFSPDGKRVVIALEDRTLRIWNADGSLLSVHTVSENFVGTVAAFSPDGTRVLTASEEGLARIVMLDGRTEIELKGHKGGVSSGVFSPDGRQVLTASYDGTARIFDLDGRLRTELSGHKGRVWSAAWSPDGKSVLTRAEDQLVRIFATDGRLIGELRGPHQNLHLAAFAGDGSRVLTIEDSSILRSWRLDSGGSRELIPLRGEVEQLSLSPNGQRILAVMMDGSARLVSKDGSRPVSLSAHRAYRGAITDDGRAVTVSADGVLRAWKEDGAGAVTLPHHARSDATLVLSSDGKRILVEAERGKALVINTDGTPAIELPVQNAIVTSAAFSPDARSVAVGYHSFILTFDLFGKLSQPVAKDVAYVSGLSWGADGVLRGSLGSELRRWTSGPGGAWTSVGATDYGESIHTFQPSGREPQVLLAGERRVLSLAWQDGRRVPLRLFASGYASAVLSADARYLIASAEDQKVRIWDLDREALRRAMWLSPARCLSPGARRSLLGEEQAQAERGEALCSELRSCMSQDGTGAPDPARYERCYGVFRSAQGPAANPPR